MSDVAEVVTGWVAGALGPEVDVAYGELPEAPVACEVRCSPGDPWVTRYLSGGGIKRLPYEVYLRVDPRGSEGPRFDALSALRALQARVEAHESPGGGVAWVSHEVTAVPSEYQTDKGGRVTYQLCATLEYHERG